MKKLMMAVAVVACAMMANASQYTWAAKTGYFYQPGTSTKITADAIGYLFDNAVITRTELLADLADGTYTDVADAFNSIGVKAAATTAVGDNARFDTSAEFEYGEAGTHNFYAVMVADSVDDAVYFTALKEVEGSATAGDTATIKFATLNSSQNAIASTATVGDAGWYAVSVPEPFSGTLALLGMGAIALRRKMKKAKKA